MTSKIYQIRNKATGEYLSAGRSAGTPPIAEASQENDGSQHWKITLQASSTGTIQNVKFPTFLVPSTTAPFFAPTSPNWTIGLTLSGLDLQAYFGFSSGGRGFYLRLGTTKVLTMSTPYNIAVDSWNLILTDPPESPPTPESPSPTPLIKKDLALPVPTQYRIRSLYKSKYLLTMSDSRKVYITGQMQTADLQRQTWTVTYIAATGLYTIQNNHTIDNRNYFLTANVEAEGSAVSGRNNEYHWTIQGFNQGLHFLIGISRPNPTLSIGFSDYEAEEYDEVALVDSDAIPSQLWFFERAKPIGSDQIHAQPFPEGTYIIRNSQSNKFMYMKNDGSRKLGTREHTPATPVTSFILRRVETAPHLFTLEMRDGATTRFVVDSSGIVELRASVDRSNGSAQWIVLPHKSRTRTVYYICRPAAEHPVQAISGREIEDGEVPLEEMVKGNTLHQWDFVLRD